MTGWNGRGTGASRGYGARWRKLRDRIMRRDKCLCQPCLQHGRLTPATAVDHITPKSQGGTDDHENLQAICKPCHNGKTQAEARGKVYTEKGCGADGMPTNPGHHWRR